MTLATPLFRKKRTVAKWCIPIFQVNGVNVECENYSRVAEMIRTGWTSRSSQLELLVVDEASDQYRYFDQQNIALSTDQHLVDVVVCSDEPVARAEGLCNVYVSF